MHKVKYGLFYDNHTHMENPDVGKNFDPEHFTDEIKKCGVDFLAFHARCNTGMAYYNTKIGTRHPALQYDLFGKLAECCQKKEIALLAYFNGGISTMEAVAHREWQTQYMPGTGYYGQITPFALTMCYNSPFRNHLIAMVKEIVTNYKVEGVFIDCLEKYPCVCPTCVAEMKERGIDWNDKEAVTEFATFSIRRLCSDIAKAVKEILPDPVLYFNGPAFGYVRDLDTYFDCECLPTSSGWGYEYLPTAAHYMRNLKEGHQILNMTGRFYDWGDFGGLRTADSLKFDLLYGAAHGMRPNIGGHFHPRGDKDQAVFDRIREVYQELQKYDKWTLDAVNPADIAIIYPVDCKFKKPDVKQIRSAVRVLEELKMQFDIVFADYEKSWDQYKLLILPEEVEINESMEKRVREFIAKGGAFFACGKNAAEKFGKELGIEYLGECGMNPVYFQMNGEFNKDVEDMYLTLYANASKARLAGATGASRLVKPYYNQSWTGTHAIYYTPPQEETDMPFITVKDNCIWSAGDIFSGYAKRGALHLRNIIRNIIAKLLDKPLIKVESLPSFSRLILAEKDNALNAHILSYVPEKRSDSFVVEDPIAVIDGKFSVLTNGRKVKAVTQVPEQIPVEFTTDGDYTTITLPVFKGYILINIAFES